MNNFLVSNISDRKHNKIYEQFGKGAFFDLEPDQHGWDDYLNVNVGDTVYVINNNRNVVLAYTVTKVMNDVLLSDDSVWGHKIESDTGGKTKVIFGKPCERIGKEYSAFVKSNNILSPKLNPETGQMYQGFNCATF